MKKQAVCQYYGKVFEEVDENNITHEYLSECATHEVEHLNTKATFKNNLEETLKVLDNKYDSVSSYNKISVHTCYDEHYYGTDITYSFNLQSNKLDKNYNIEIVVQYEDKENIPATKDIIEKIEKYYICNIKKEYKGLITYEDWCGGDGADDFMIGDRYIRDVFQELRGKTIEIKILD